MRILMLILLICSFIPPAFSQKFDLDTIQYKGSSDTLINIVFLGDGYTYNELDKFVNDVQRSANALFEEIPMSNYKDYFNVFAIKVPSNVSGAARDPNNLIDNYYGSTYNSYGIDRLLVPMRNEKIMDVLANNFPSYDHVIMIVNDDKYGGSGGWLATFSTHFQALGICLHEFGHSFGQLSDEYWAGPQYARENINMTQETNLEKLRWKNWLGSFNIGVYSFEESPSWYRPHQSCKMRYLGVPYCSVCKESIIEQIHSLTPPLVSYSPLSAVSTTSGYPLSFKLNLIKPNPNTLQIKWILNDITSNVDGSEFTVNEKDLSPGVNRLTANIEDVTDLLRVDHHNSIHLSVVNWIINNPTTGINDISLSSKNINVSISPNPCQDYLKIKFKDPLKGNLEIKIIDTNGRTQISKTFKQQEYYLLHLSYLKAGFYILKLYTDDVLIATSKIVKV